MTYQGQPVAQGEIQLFSQDTGVGAVGKIRDGTFSVEDKLPVGTYQVAIVPPRVPPDPTSPVAPQPVKTNLPRKVQDVNSSGLQVVLRPGSNQVELRVPE